MYSVEILLIGLCAVTAWFWLDSLKVREAAVSAARTACAVEGVMLLDDTVSISALRPARDPQGRVRLRRTYTFEYSDTGDNRRTGIVVLLGRDLVLINVG